MTARIWLCADDFGISNAVNTAIRDLVVRGRLNSTSVLVAAPSFHRSEAASLDALNSIAPRVAIGLHVALTAPFRPVSQGFQPVREGAFLPLAATFRHAVMHRFERDALLAEITGQIQAFTDMFGRAPDFVDGHQHVQLLPQISDAVLTAVKERAPDAWVRQCGRVVPLAARFADRKGCCWTCSAVDFGAVPPRSACAPIRPSPAPTISTRPRISRRCSRGSSPGFPTTAWSCAIRVSSMRNCSGSIRSRRCARRNMPFLPPIPSRRCWRATAWR
jgi:hypothetical protein